MELGVTSGSGDADAAAAELTVTTRTAAAAARAARMRVCIVKTLSVKYQLCGMTRCALPESGFPLSGVTHRVYRSVPCKCGSNTFVQMEALTLSCHVPKVSGSVTRQQHSL
ncbi:hypothetical protein GCM10027203_17370 [Nonomuraea fastidiosa]